MSTSVLHANNDGRGEGRSRHDVNGAMGRDSEHETTQGGGRREGNDDIHRRNSPPTDRGNTTRHGEQRRQGRDSGTGNNSEKEPLVGDHAPPIATAQGDRGAGRDYDEKQPYFRRDERHRGIPGTNRTAQGGGQHYATEHDERKDKNEDKHFPKPRGGGRPHHRREHCENGHFPMDDYDRDYMRQHDLPCRFRRDRDYFYDREYNRGGESDDRLHDTQYRYRYDLDHHHVTHADYGSQRSEHMDRHHTEVCDEYSTYHRGERSRAYVRTPSSRCRPEHEPYWMHTERRPKYSHDASEDGSGCWSGSRGDDNMRRQAEEARTNRRGGKEFQARDDQSGEGTADDTVRPGGDLKAKTVLFGRPQVAEDKKKALYVAT